MNLLLMCLRSKTNTFQVHGWVKKVSEMALSKSRIVFLLRLHKLESLQDNFAH